MTTFKLLHSLSVAVYALSFALGLDAFLKSRDVLLTWAQRLLLVGMTLNAVDFILYCQLVSLAPLAQPAGFFTLLALVMFTAGHVTSRRFTLQRSGFLLMGIPLVVSFLPLILSDGPFLTPRLPTFLLVTHLVAVMLCLAAFTVSVSAGVLLYTQDRLLKRKAVGFLVESLPSLEILDEVTFRGIGWGFAFLTLGVILGFIGMGWRDTAPGQLTAKIILGVILWIIYGYYIYQRLNEGWRGRTQARFALVGFLVAVLLAVVATVRWG